MSQLKLMRQYIVRCTDFCGLCACIWSDNRGLKKGHKGIIGAYHAVYHKPLERS